MRKVSSRSTPYADDYQTCEETTAALWIYPGALDPHCISELLAIEPTTCKVMGQLQGRAVLPVSSWSISSEGIVLSKDLRRHLDWLLDTIEPKRSELLGLQENDGLVMRVQCRWWSAFGGGGPTLWPEQMSRLADLNLETFFEFAYYGEGLQIEDAPDNSC